MGVLLAFSVDEVVGQDDSTFRRERLEGSFDQMTGPVSTLGTADVTEHDDVEPAGPVAVGGLEVDGVEVTFDERTSVDDLVFGRLASGDVDHAGQIVDDGSGLGTRGEHRDRPGCTARPEVEDSRRGHR